VTRREFLKKGTCAAAAGAVIGPFTQRPLFAQVAGDRPNQAAGAAVLNPRCRVPVGLIIDDSTCLVNLNRFAMPQFDTAHAGSNQVYKRPWREWPAEIPDAFVRRFGEWCAERGIKGKYSIIPYPACVGRLDRELPGWTRQELQDSLKLVREVMAPNWDIHPEMVTHTRVIDIHSGHPFPDYSLKYMENWEWTTGRSVDELCAYMTYALRILRDAGLHCDGITTPGGFGNRVLPELAQASLLSVRDVFGTEVPHYFRHLYDAGEESVAPRVEYAARLEEPDPRCVVSIIGCTGDWTGGWDCSTPEGADRFITADLQQGRMVDVIERGEPATMVCHWTGIYWNGQELGFKIFQEVVKRLHSRFDNLIWMKLNDLSRYWAAKELTTLQPDATGLSFRAPFSCEDFTVRLSFQPKANPALVRGNSARQELQEVANQKQLRTNTWCRVDSAVVACISLPKGLSRLTVA
jgi:hypothetical protein